MKTAATRLQKTRRDVPQALGLLRVSKIVQETARQNDDLDAVEREFGIQVFKRLEIADLSGTATMTDADITALLSELHEPRVAGLAISAVDRLFRPGRQYKAWGILDAFVEARKPIWSAREGLIEAWTDEGYDKLMASGTRAGAEWREIRRRSMAEKLRLARQGVQTSATTPYGYRFKKLARRQGTWVIHEPEAQVIRKMFELAGLGYTGFKISKWLNKLGEFADREGVRIPSPRGGMWSDSVVRQTMKNPAYIGEARYAAKSDHAVVVKVPAILATEEQRAWWDAAAAARATNLERRSGRPSPNYLFQSLIYCSRCGGRMTGIRESSNRRYYGCFARNRMTHERKCPARQIRVEKLEQAVYGAILARLATRATIERILEAHREELNASRGVGAQKEERLAKLKRDEALHKLKLDDGDLIHLYKENKAKLLGVQAEIAVIERELARAGTIFVMPSSRAVAEFLKVIEDAKDWTEYEHRRGFIERTITKISYGEGRFTVEGRIVFSPAESLSDRNDEAQNPYSRLGSTTGFVPFVFSGKVAA